jgi:peptide/nickel transport system substrate-binding protein
MKKSVFLATASLFLALVLLLAGVAPLAALASQDVLQVELGPELPKAAPSARDTLNMRAPQPFTNFDPHNFAAAVDFMIDRQIYEPLIFRDDQSVYHPELATGCTVSADGMTYTFALRPGVKFSNGAPLTVEDVIFSFERAETAPLLGSYVAAIESVTKVDDSNVQFKLTAPSAPFLGNVAMICIINRAHFEAAGDKFADNPVGTGPYKLESHDKNVSLTLKANEDYWLGAASIKTVNFKVITDDSTAYLAFLSGEIDQITVPTANWQDVKASGKWSIEEIGSPSVSYVQYNNQLKPFDNVLVRQAINYAINREDMLLIAVDGMALPTSMMCNPDYIFGATSDATQYTYDPDKARDLLKQAGYENGFDAGAILTVAGYFEKMANVLQQNLADVGITATIETREFSSYLSDVMKGNYTIGVLALALDPDMDAYSVLYTTATINNLNMARYSNPAVDELFAQGKITIDTQKRKDIYRQIIQIVQDDAVYAPCFNSIVPIAYDKNLFYMTYTSMSVRLYECYWLK